jgi:hypothetical protein
MPIVSKPPSAVSSPSNTCRKFTACPRLAVIRASESSRSPAVELSPSTFVLARTQAVAAATAFLPRMPVARNFPRLLSEAGVPSRFHVTAAPICFAAARCAFVGRSFPVRTSSSTAPWSCWTTETAAPGTSSAESTTAQTTHKSGRAGIACSPFPLR